MKYTSIHAICMDGQLIGFDDQDGNSYPQGQELTFPAGSNLYWSPLNESVWEDGALSPERAKIYFTVYNDEIIVCSGTLYITGAESENDLATQRYTATLVGPGLQISQNQSLPGAIISLAS